MMDGQATRCGVLAALVLVTACSREQATKTGGTYETLTLRYEGSAGIVSIPELAEDLGYLAPIKLNYIGNNSTGGPHSIQAVATGDIDFGGSFNGSIVNLVSRHAPIRSVVANYGVDELVFSGFYVLDDSPIRTARDLIGKKVAMNTLGAHHEFVLREYLARSGLSTQEAAQVSMVAVPAINAELSLREKQVEVAVLGSVLRDRALERGHLRMLFSDHELLGNFTAGSYVMSSPFIATHQKTVRHFVDAIGRTFDWANAQPRAAVLARMEAIIRKRGRNEDTSVVRHWLGTSIDSPRGRLKDIDFQRWIDWLVRDGQLKAGQVEPSAVYTNEFQPTAQGHATAARGGR
ncbi:MAG: hypothetical protein RLZZ450_1151 [Pseudomonadota bacterium]|jgi:ABC-type nitrate/sulfonate/bicarbonate transport system substrate-binding protein